MASHQELFNPVLPEFHADPYPFYHRLRSVAPVYQAPMGLWVLTRYDDVVMVLRDGRFGRDGLEQLIAEACGGDKEGGRLSRYMLFRDVTDTTALRSIGSMLCNPSVDEYMK